MTPDQGTPRIAGYISPDGLTDKELDEYEARYRAGTEKELAPVIAAMEAAGLFEAGFQVAAPEVLVLSPLAGFVDAVTAERLRLARDLIRAVPGLAVFPSVLIVLRGAAISLFGDGEPRWVSSMYVRVAR